MVPTFQPDGRLRTALASVLSQPLPRAAVQITVVDDGSQTDDVERWVRDVDPGGRVEVVRHDTRLGLAGNWNRAIALARGELVHLLHQDDYVLPGFYDRVARGFTATSDSGMAFCRTRIVDGMDRPIKVSSRLQWLPGVLSGWLRNIGVRQRIQTPSAIVRRQVYERVGGFRTDLQQALDWEMWVRIAAHYPVWYEPRCLAVYRRHQANESARLSFQGTVWPDMIRAIEINAASLPDDIRAETLEDCVLWHVSSALRSAERLIAAGAIDHAATTIGFLPDLLRLLDRPLAALAATRRIEAARTSLIHNSRTARRAA
jgi:glycosyltransferase involved in cell wall biosynthesis